MCEGGRARWSENESLLAQTQAQIHKHRKQNGESEVSQLFVIREGEGEGRGEKRRQEEGREGGRRVSYSRPGGTAIRIRKVTKSKEQ
jgi:hypothetical protein